MGRTYKRALGSRAYKNYTEENLRAAVAAIKDRTLSYRNASLKFGIPKNTLLLKVKGRHTHNVGRQAVFTDHEEKLFVAHAVALSTFGFPMTMFDLRCAVKSYLDRNVIQVIDKPIKMGRRDIYSVKELRSYLEL